MRIAILEIDRSQACLLQHWLIAAGHVPHRYDGSAQLIKDVQSDGFDALLLDWSDVGNQGMDVLSHVRQQMKSSVPVVVITSRQREEDMVHALQQGADDCIAKPIRHRELLARLQSVRRHTRNLTLITQSIEVGRLRLDVAARRAYVDSVAIELTAKDGSIPLEQCGTVFAPSTNQRSGMGTQYPAAFAHAGHTYEPRSH
jgi:DNA-binding response OmpR family regulator